MKSQYRITGEVDQPAADTSGGHNVDAQCRSPEQSAGTQGHHDGIHAETDDEHSVKAADDHAAGHDSGNAGPQRPVVDDIELAQHGGAETERGGGGQIKSVSGQCGKQSQRENKQRGLGTEDCTRGAGVEKFGGPQDSEQGDHECPDSKQAQPPHPVRQLDVEP